MKNRRALLVTSDFPPRAMGGIARYYYDLCRSAGSDISVVTPGERYADFDAVQPFAVFRKKVTAAPGTIQRLIQTFVLVWFAVRTARRHGYSAIIFGHWYLALTAPLVRAFTNLKCAVILHGGELRPYRKQPFFVRLATACLRNSALIICNSAYTENEYKSLDNKAPPTAIITPGVDYPRFEDRDGGKVLTRHGLTGKKVLLTVGNLVPRKGHDTGIRALSALLGQGFDVHYLIVGCGPEESNLRRLADELKVSGSVTFAGRIAEEELPDYYDACDIFIMLSRSESEGRQAIEGFGIVYLEANCCGKPVVGVRSGGVAEAVEHGRTGLLVSPEDSLNGAIDAISALLNAPARAHQLGAQGEARARDEFSLESKGRQFAACIAKLTEGAAS